MSSSNTIKFKGLSPVDALKGDVFMIGDKEWEVLRAFCMKAVRHRELEKDMEKWRDILDSKKMYEYTKQQAEELSSFLSAQLEEINSVCNKVVKDFYLCDEWWKTVSTGICAYHSELGELRKEFPVSRECIIYEPVLSHRNRLLIPYHHLSLESIQRFISFLNTCNGFSIR